MNLKLFGFVAAAAILGGLIAVNYGPALSLSNPAPTEPCRQPLTYHFGDIDSRFHISRQQLSEVMQEVEKLWATALDRQLLDYREDGKVAINLVYSKEQKRTDKEESLAKRLQVMKDQVEAKKNEYNRLKKTFKNRRSDFELLLSRYNQQAHSYNERAAKWDGKKIPDTAMRKLQKMKRELKRMKRTVDRRKENLESLRRRTNAKSRQLNQLLEQQNELISKYNNQFSEAHKFNQGRYIKQGKDEHINIFQFANIAQLKTVLAHEAGHALGLDHVENPKSVMYPIMDKQDIFDLSLTQQDVAAIQQRCPNN